MHFKSINETLNTKTKTKTKTHGKLVKNPKTQHSKVQIKVLYKKMTENVN